MNKKRKAQGELLNLLIIVIVLAALISFMFFIRTSQKQITKEATYQSYVYRYNENLLQNLYYTTMGESGYNLADVIAHGVQYGKYNESYQIDISNRTIFVFNITRDYFNKTMKDYNYYFYVDYPGKVLMKDSVEGGKYPRLNACNKEICNAEALPPANKEIIVYELLIPLPLRNETKAYLAVWN